jgi:hypothetical protein
MPVSTPFYSDEVLNVAFWRNAAIVDVAGSMTLARMLIVSRAYRALRVAHPRGIVVYCVNRAGAPLASQEVRVEMIRLIKELGDALLAFILVLEDSGLVAQVIRSVIRGINVMSRRSTMVAFATLEEGIASASPLLSGSKDDGDLAGELRRAVLEVCRPRAPMLGELISRGHGPAHVDPLPPIAGSTSSARSCRAGR